MPVIKSAIKRVRTNEKGRSHNVAIKEEMRAAVKELEAKINEGNVDEAKKAYANAARKLDKAGRKNIIHENKAARLKSRFSKKISAL